VVNQNPFIPLYITQRRRVGNNHIIFRVSYYILIYIAFAFSEPRLILTDERALLQPRGIFSHLFDSQSVSRQRSYGYCWFHRVCALLLVRNGIAKQGRRLLRISRELEFSPTRR